MVTVTFSHQGEFDSNVSDELVGTAAAAAAAPAAEARIRAAIARNTFSLLRPAAPAASLPPPPASPNARMGIRVRALEFRSSALAPSDVASANSAQALVRTGGDGRRLSRPSKAARRPE